MKNLLLSIPLIMFFSSCGNSSTNQGVDYFFELEFGGETHEVRGNTCDDNLHMNSCANTVGGGVGFGISDKSADNYVSGQNLHLAMAFDNLSIGTNTGSLGFNGNLPSSWLGNYFESIGVEFPYYFSETQGIYSSSSQRNVISGISISDLGTPSINCGNGCNPTYWSTCFGETLKGSYEGTLYFLDQNAPQTFSIAVPIKIDFNAVRFY